ncbi:internalin I-like [Pararge aegeria]|uniref:internalin I-like n=1 Tax=Pararge aegeria TaxID=116150 RepID=UPI0019D2FB1B|nr:internalin I-like [Pararge aegeria]
MSSTGILTFMLICVVFTFVRAIKFYQNPESRRNLCDENYDDKIKCFCNKDLFHPDFIETFCFLTVDEVPNEDPIWNNFKDLENASSIIWSGYGKTVVKFIPTNALIYTKVLLEIIVLYGNIDVIEPFAFANSTSLEFITLKDNQIMVLKPYAFAHLRNLMTITIDINLIKEINADVFIDLPSLEKIYLSHNEITTIHDKAFVHLPNLIELEINLNNLSSLNSKTFLGLENLQQLDISGNSLQVIDDNTFVQLKKLLTLKLGRNKIQMLEKKAFVGLVNLNYLSLADNNLIAIDNKQIFEELQSMTQLDLKGNKLQTLKAEVMAPIFNNLLKYTSSLYFQDNSFLCNCELEWFMILMKNTQSTHIKSSINNLKCTPSSEQVKWLKAIEARKPTTSYITLSDNTELTGQIFYRDLEYLLNCDTNFNNMLLITINTNQSTDQELEESTPGNIDKITSQDQFDWSKVFSTGLLEILQSDESIGEITSQDLSDSSQSSTVGTDTYQRSDGSIDKITSQGLLDSLQGSSTVGIDTYQRNDGSIDKITSQGLSDSSQVSSTVSIETSQSNEHSYGDTKRNYTSTLNEPGDNIFYDQSPTSSDQTSTEITGHVKDFDVFSSEEHKNFGYVFTLFALLGLSLFLLVAIFIDVFITRRYFAIVYYI